MICSRQVLDSQPLWGLLSQRGSKWPRIPPYKNDMIDVFSLDTVAFMWKACHFSWHCLLDPHLAQISKRAILFCLTPRLAGLSAVVVSQLSTATQHCLRYASPSRKTLRGSSWLWITQFSSCHNSSLEAACFLHSWFSSAEMQGIALTLEVADFKPRNISKPKNKASTLGNIRILQELPKSSFGKKTDMN